MTTSARPLLVTHSGTFHLDDAFAYAVLKLALGLSAPGLDHTLTRTRDRQVIERADFVWDVGNIHDPALGRFDHHQRGAPVRDDGVPLSAAGLIWQCYGEVAVTALLGQDTPVSLVGAVAVEFDRDVVHRMDEIDNGIKDPEDSLGLSSLVADCNLPWDSTGIGNQDAEDAAFGCASVVVARFLYHRVIAVRARLDAEAVVLAACAAASDPRLLELGRKMPWHDIVRRHGLPVFLSVYPVPDGNWVIDAMPDGLSGYCLPLPAAWAGLRDEALVAVTGVDDAVFVHPPRFLGVAASRTGALAMALLTLDRDQP